ncbi:hypothetical protein [Singulisphaera sp. PoT]|uniref:hypothetical protein n=1 Tax=Singulisphaera sp. PoT TaxID=3411797 RepID=UPI003BF4ED7F
MAEESWINEPERHVHDAALGLVCHIYGLAPVQADGRLAGHPFYFRARHDFWTFTLCTNADIDPSCINPPEENQVGLFRDGEYEGYELAGDYGSPRGHEASFMPYAEAERLIRECAARYLRESNDPGFRAPSQG